jgi:hypothetical protein
VKAHENIYSVTCDGGWRKQTFEKTRKEKKSSKKQKQNLKKKKQQTKLFFGVLSCA